MAHERELRGNLSLSGLPSSYKFLDVSFSALRLRFYFDIKYIGYIITKSHLTDSASARNFYQTKFIF